MIASGHSCGNTYKNGIPECTSKTHKLQKAKSKKAKYKTWFSLAQAKNRNLHNSLTKLAMQRDQYG